MAASAETLENIYTAVLYGCYKTQHLLPGAVSDSQS